MIKTFRGLIVDGGQDTLNLHTNDGKTGYRIAKFQIIKEQPGDVAQESVVQIWKIQQATVPTATATIDFSDQTLLGAAIGMYGGISGNTTPFLESIVFDKEIFNQDIYITHTDNENAESINYYIELEQMPLDLNEATVATLQSIRNA